jgi:hypothetical protein
MYQVYQSKGNASVTLPLLSMSISSMDTYFILKNIGMIERHITMKFVLRDRLLINLKLTTMES